ncbi:hypothetical protein [Caldimonas taiwanensis]|uniref:hypothetical protein n=1 Tax=Caldimonas taiwanensis TaxID=307483 RepID=UPI00078232AD|nr:hypothetical protein [Caldimonas taiwanensis]
MADQSSTSATAGQEAAPTRRGTLTGGRTHEDELATTRVYQCRGLLFFLLRNFSGEYKPRDMASEEDVIATIQACIRLLGDFEHPEAVRRIGHQAVSCAVEARAILTVLAKTAWWPPGDEAPDGGRQAVMEDVIVNALWAADDLLREVEDAVDGETPASGVH